MISPDTGQIYFRFSLLLRAAITVEDQVVFNLIDSHDME